MDKRGFTLIELLTVVAILSLLFVIAIPKINTAFKESKADQLQEIREMVAEATDVFLNYDCGKNTYDALKDNKEIKIYLNVMSDCGVIEEKIYNPVSGEYFNIDNEYIIVKLDEVGMINYELSF